MKLAAGIDEE